MRRRKTTRRKTKEIEAGDIPQKKTRRSRRKATSAKAEKAKRAVAKTKGPDVGSVTMDQFAADCLYEYGSYVVLERAVPDFRDGLKPVHRHILWAMKELGLKSNSAYKKAARTVGDVIGKYHPHGDSSIYGGMVTLANFQQQPNLVDGQGNWGSPVDGAAAMRYTEARLSKFSEIFLLDPGYLKTVPMVPNFDDSLKIPLYLPATLPVQLITGSAGIAFGVSASNPSFDLQSVYDTTVAGLKALQRNKKITSTTCAKHLRIAHVYDCLETSGEEEFGTLISEGKGSIAFRPQINANFEDKIIEIVSYSPSFRGLDGVAKKMDKIASFDGVSKVGDNSGKKNKKAGPLGAYYFVTPTRGISEDKFYDLADKVIKELTGKESYDLGCTVRHVEKKHQFYKISYAGFINNWCRYRVNLEQKYIEVLIGEAEKEIERLELMVFAVDHRKQIIACLDKPDPDTALSKSLKIPMEKAKRILDLQVRRLAKLEKAPLLQSIKEQKAKISGLKKDHKDPIPRILSTTKEQYARFTKAVGIK